MAFSAAMAFAFALVLAQEDPLAEGMKALQANRPAVAEALLRKAVAAEPKQYGAHFNLALALSLQGKDLEAIASYRTTLALQPGLYQANLNLGLLLLRQKMYFQALPVLKDAVAAKPKDGRPNLLYAQALLESGDDAEAEKYFRTVLEAGTDPGAALGLGRALAGQGKLDEAVTVFQTAAAADPTYKPALLDLAALYEKAGQPTQAAAIYRQFPENAQAQQRLGEMLIDSKEFAAAIPKLEQTVEEAPTSANRINLGTAYKLAKQPEKAAEQYRLASEAEPGSYDLRMTYGRELRDLRKFLPAAQQFAAAANGRPDSVEAWNELAGVLIIAENYGPGLAALDRVKALGKETPGNHYLRAITLDKLRQPKPALESYRLFLDTDGGKLQDEEFKARQRMRIIQRELDKK